ncbi:hypothetical protein XENTR_v10017660 [Xenopus tropicalis]|nr:hypothetical protein XENTR_v10017660 [Xenopus tropicalis]
MACMLGVCVIVSLCAFIQYLTHSFSFLSFHISSLHLLSGLTLFVHCSVLVPFVLYILFSVQPLPTVPFNSLSPRSHVHIQPHSVLQQKQVVFQQQIAIHQHRQSQLLHASTHLQLAQPQPATQQGLQTPGTQQTLVVQPMLQATSESAIPTKAPVPIQPKQPGKGVPPLNLQGHLGAKASQGTRPLPIPSPSQPHIPVQLVGARQQGPGISLGGHSSSLTSILHDTVDSAPFSCPCCFCGGRRSAGKPSWVLWSSAGKTIWSREEEGRGRG